MHSMRAETMLPNAIGRRYEAPSIRSIIESIPVPHLKYLLNYVSTNKEHRIHLSQSKATTQPSPQPNTAEDSATTLDCVQHP